MWLTNAWVRAWLVMGPAVAIKVLPGVVEVSIMHSWRRARVGRSFTLAVLIVSGTLAGCTSTSDRAAKPRRSARATSTTVAWQAPDHGVFVPAADVPDINTVSDRSRLWAYAATVCREYDRSHGTTSSITVDVLPPPWNQQPKSNTPCFKSGDDFAIAR